MGIHYEQFPLELSALAGTPTWAVDIIKLGGGAEQRVIRHADSLRRYDAATAIMIESEYRAVMRHFNARRAQGYGFPLKDRSFYTVTNEPLGTGGGIGSTNQLTLNEGDASNPYNREIYMPVQGTIQVRANGNLKVENTDYTIAYTGANGGRVTWLVSVSGQTLTWSGEFNVPVRYDTGSLPDPELFLHRNDSNTGLVQSISIPLVEIRFAAEW